MRVVFGLVLVLGMGLAGFAVYMARGYINNTQAQLEAARAAEARIVKTTDVFVVKHPVRYGERLTPEDVRAVRWPVDALPDGVFKTKEELFPKGEEVPRTVLRTMEKNEAVLAVKVTEPGQDAGVSSRLTKGMRAFAIKVDVTSGVSGFLRPGDRVDVYWTGRGIGEQSANLTKLIQSSIKILAVDQTADTDRSAATIARTITVEGTPLQVAALAQAQATGRLTLSLVGAEDTTTADAVQYDGNDLLGIQQQEVVKAAPKRVCSIKTRRGAEIVETPIPCPATN